jgi:hypothetical protein
MHLVHRKTCRVCGSKALVPVIDLGEQYLQGSFRKPGMTPPMRKIPCTLVRCDPTVDERACGLLQMSHSVPPEILYSDYWYRSGTNQTMRDHLAGIVKTAVGILSPAARDGNTHLDALDIGCNDGTLLKAYPKGWRLCGVDPSDVAAGIKDMEIVRDVFPSAKLKTRMDAERIASFEVITTIAMFYDLEDPVTFAKAVREILSEHGIWVLEMSYMPQMLASTSYDTVCHEHLEYYSLTVLERIMSLAGLRVFRADLNASNGGSIRCYVSKQGADYFADGWEADLRKLRQQEFDLELETNKPYASFQERINVHRDELVALLKDLKAAGKRIHIYGASTKGNTILQWCGLDARTIDYAADRNPEKHGAFTLGTDIPIISEEASRKMKPDYYLVLPWHFKKEFMQREKAALQAGTGFIFPLPKIEVITARNSKRK